MRDRAKVYAMIHHRSTCQIYDAKAISHLLQGTTSDHLCRSSHGPGLLTRLFFFLALFLCAILFSGFVFNFPF